MNLAEWSALVGALMPALIAVVNQPHWPPWARAVMTVLSCIVAGGITAAVEGRFTGVGLVESVGVVLVAALAAYRWWWKPSGIADTIETRTTPGIRGATR